MFLSLLLFYFVSFVIVLTVLVLKSSCRKGAFKPGNSTLGRSPGRERGCVSRLLGLGLGLLTPTPAPSFTDMTLLVRPRVKLFLSLN